MIGPEQPCGCVYAGSERVSQCQAHAEREARLRPPAALHERGGPLPTFVPGYQHERLAQVIQEARGRIHEGTEPMDVGSYLAEHVFGLPLSENDLKIAIGYLLKAAESKARLDILRDQRAARALAADPEIDPVKLQALRDGVSTGRNLLPGLFGPAAEPALASAPEEPPPDPEPDAAA